MTLAASASAPSKPDVVPQRWLITGCTIVATLMQSLDQTIANVALPSMQGSLSASREQITWVLTSYVIAAAIMTAPVGWMAARFGRKQLFVVCLIGFTVSSALCGLAQTLNEEVLFRVLQGCFGAAMVPLSQSIMLDIYRPEERGKAMSIWTTGVMIGPILGPTLGGYLTENFDWRWVFFINVPFGIIATLGFITFFKDQHRDTSLRFDWTGFTVLAIGLAAFQLMLDRGSQLEWFGSTEIIIEAVIAALGFYLFTVHMLTAEKPFIPPAIFRDVSFISALITMFIVGLVLLGSAALLPGYLQNLGGYSASASGWLMAPRGIGAMLTMILAGVIMKHFDPRVVMAAGTLILSGTLWEMSTWTPNIDAYSLTVVTLIQGAALSFIFVPLQVLGFSTLDPALRTNGAALFSLLRNIGSAVGVSVMASLLLSNAGVVAAQLSEHITPFNRALSEGASGLFLGPGTPFGLANANAMVQHEALITAYSNDFLLMFWISLPLLPLVFFLKRPAPAAKGSAPPEIVAD